MNLIQDIFQSKKFIAMIIGIIAVLLGDVFGASTASLGWVTATLSAYLLSQGLADHGKEAAYYANDALFLDDPDLMMEDDDLLGDSARIGYMNQNQYKDKC
jgi:hypothetical protein